MERDKRNAESDCSPHFNPEINFFFELVFSVANCRLTTSACQQVSSAARLFPSVALRLLFGQAVELTVRDVPQAMSVLPGFRIFSAQ